MTSLPNTTPTILHSVSNHTLSLDSHPSPIPSPSQYTLQVHYTTFTNGELLWPEPNSLPQPIPGFDILATVLSPPSAAPAAGVTYFPPGTRVYGFTSFSRPGNARGISVAEHSELTEVPEGLESSAAVSVPLSGLTAWQALFGKGGLETTEGANRGRRVLVSAAAGGVGIWAVQVARWAGAEVVGICGAKNAEFVKELGANEVLDYRSTKVGECVREKDGRMFDVVIDCVGGEALKEAWLAVKEGGVLISIVAPLDNQKPLEGVKAGVKSLFFIVEPNGDELKQLGKLIVGKKLRPVVDSVWPLEEYHKAWERVIGGHVTGKVVLQVSQ